MANLKSTTNWKDLVTFLSSHLAPNFGMNLDKLNGGLWAQKVGKFEQLLQVAWLTPSPKIFKYFLYSAISIFQLKGGS